MRICHRYRLSAGKQQFVHLSLDPQIRTDGQRKGTNIFPSSRRRSFSFSGRTSALLQRDSQRS